MRLIKSFLILLIGMISFTVLGTTTHPEQKQTPIVTMECIVPVTVVNVASFEGAFCNVAGFREITIKAKRSYCINEPLLVNPLDDTGVIYKKLVKSKIHYKEKLNKDYTFIDDKLTYNCRSNC